MNHTAISIRSFIGANNYEESTNFYRDLGFNQVILSETLTYVSVNDKLGFYLQRAYVKDWVDNTMLFLEVDDVQRYWKEVNELQLPEKYPQARLSAIQVMDWGSEFFVHDPAGILWHIGQFNR